MGFLTGLLGLQFNNWVPKGKVKPEEDKGVAKNERVRILSRSLGQLMKQSHKAFKQFVAFFLYAVFSFKYVFMESTDGGHDLTQSNASSLRH